MNLDTLDRFFEGAQIWILILSVEFLGIRDYYT